MSGTGKVEAYLDDAGEYRWRRVAGNGEIVSTSGEGYVRGDYAIDAALREARAHDVPLEVLYDPDYDTGATGGQAGDDDGGALGE